MLTEADVQRWVDVSNRCLSELGWPECFWRKGENVNGWDFTIPHAVMFQAIRIGQKAAGAHQGACWPCWHDATHILLTGGDTDIGSRCIKGDCRYLGLQPIPPRELIVRSPAASSRRPR